MVRAGVVAALGLLMAVGRVGADDDAAAVLLSLGRLTGRLAVEGAGAAGDVAQDVRAAEGCEGTRGANLASDLMAHFDGDPQASVDAVAFARWVATSETVAMVLPKAPPTPPGYPCDAVSIGIVAASLTNANGTMSRGDLAALLRAQCGDALGDDLEAWARIQDIDPVPYDEYAKWRAGVFLLSPATTTAPPGRSIDVSRTALIAGGAVALALGLCVALAYAAHAAAVARDRKRQFASRYVSGASRAAPAPFRDNTGVATTQNPLATTQNTLATPGYARPGASGV